jgi:hypothetical protein
MLRWLAALSLLAFTPARADTVLVPANATWRYLDDGSDQGAAWRAAAFDDARWRAGAAQLGYGDGDEATVVRYGPDAGHKWITTYFRARFDVPDPAAIGALRLRLLRDDGAVVYLNGVEVRRDNMPAGAVTAGTRASVALGAPQESTFTETRVDAGRLVRGANVLAVEVHQANPTSSDVSFALELLAVPVAPAALVPAGSTWRYLDDGSDQGVAWRAPAFDDAAWRSGRAQLGYGDGDEATVVRYGPDPAHKWTTTYFRARFDVPDPAAVPGLRLRLLRDDGAVVYLNGAEVRRENMPAGAVTAATRASVALGGAAESAFGESAIDPRLLVRGANVLAVEVHQANPDSSDVSFDLELRALDPVTVTRGPYLQRATPTSVVVRWRTAGAVVGRVRYGADPAHLDRAADEAAATTEHEVALTGLAPDTRYAFTAGPAAGSFATVGPDAPVRVWVLGDSGKANAGQIAVRDGFARFAGAQPIDAWLMLGDNAYESGTDDEYQRGLFAIYPTTLQQAALWPTLGNHDTAQSTNPPANLPYFQIFSLPTAAEAGGRPSGTEKYYSFDLGEVHFVCLDSQSSSRAADGPMLRWLADDLAATRRTWIVAYWHHPPYSKGGHDSDVGAPSPEIRQWVLPVLEAGGVDLVLTGHSHDYERSFLIDGHYGTSATFAPSMLVDGGDGREDGDGAYVKPRARTPHAGTVYVVAGSSATVASWAGGSTALVNPTPHPVMARSLRALGSLVLDADGDRLDVSFVRDTGAVDDAFTIEKPGP